jgi:uracil-DNA glycosylase
MAHTFDPGYCASAFQQLVRDYPDEQLYPFQDFRTEWGPIFHRGRLDGSARVLIIGQDPAQHETMARRILVGEAGQRIQGFLAKLGMDRSYVMINTFLYSVYGQGGGTKHKNDPAIAAYRNRWIDAIFASSGIEAVISLGQLADNAFQLWKATASGQASHVFAAHITHPTQPESSAGNDSVKHAAAIKTMLQNWNAALPALNGAIQHPDRSVALKLYGDQFVDGDELEIPELDMPAGLPAWMRGAKNWATRTGANAAMKRVTITVTIPKGARPA